MTRFLLHVFFVVVTFTIFQQYEAAKILAVFPTPSRSHYIVAQGMLKELANRGHEVTSVSPYPLDKPHKNFRDISIESVIKELERQVGFILTASKNGLFSLTKIHDVALSLTEYTLNEPNFRKLLDSNEKFDLAIIEIINNEAQLAIGNHFNCPVIGFSSMGPSTFTNDITGNPEPAAWVPNIKSLCSDKMDFKCRFTNYLALTIKYFYRRIFYFPKQDAIMHKYFPNTPDIFSVMHNVSLTFLNSHPSFSYPRPYMSSTIEIGGLHIPETKPLPEDIKKFLDDAHDGAIFISLGSNIKSVELELEKRNAFIDVISQLKYRVIWKWDETSVANQPKNLKLGKWFPQSDILAHPNLKLFITHGGLGSVTESMWHGVPMVGIPFFGDQPTNIARVVNLEIGVKLDNDNITEESLMEAINEVLKNPKYARNAKERSDLYQDQPQTPLEKSIYWVEYVLRHGGASHLRPAVFDLYWFQVILLDIWLFIGAIILSSIFVIKLLFKLLCKCCGKKSKKVKTQ